ncbi:MAG: phosphopantetheine-binding protein [Phycisphaerae bacterium]|nr:phosphopantetheine-binding protein [Phycisphaerae bacterium]
MPAGTMKSRDEIISDVQVVLEDALGVDAGKVTLDATLTGDLGAESIDFLDIVFRLEKKFSTPDRPFKIQQGELFPENLMTDPSLVNNGRVTAKALAMLKERMPHVDLSTFEGNPDVSKLSEIFTVKSLVDFVERKLKA